MRLAMKGPKPMMRGPIDLKVKIEWPPGKGGAAEKLKLSGTFALRQVHFTGPTVQDKIDDLSSRAQGKPSDESVDETPANLMGNFRLANGIIEFSRLRLTIPGANLALTGTYTFAQEAIDFRGQLRPEAKISQTMKGWKRWALKPLDPFFSKDGAGTQLQVMINGTREDPHFRRDRGK